MADVLFGDLGFIPVPKRKERQFRLRDDFSLTDFSDNELRSRYRFGPECIEFLVELLRDDLERPTSRKGRYKSRTGSTRIADLNKNSTYC